MSRFAIFLAASLLLAAPAAAQAPASVSLAPGDAATVQVEESGAVVISPRPGAADWTPTDIAAARHLSGQPSPDQAVPYASMLPDDGTVPAPQPVAPHMIRIKFLSIAGEHSLLVVENGYDQAIAYRARMTRGDRTTPTDVCLVPPRQRGYEHWPHTIDRVEVYDVRFVAWRKGDPIPCA